MKRRFYFILLVLADPACDPRVRNQGGKAECAASTPFRVAREDERGPAIFVGPRTIESRNPTSKRSDSSEDRNT